MSSSKEQVEYLPLTQIVRALERAKSELQTKIDELSKRISILDTLQKDMRDRAVMMEDVGPIPIFTFEACEAPIYYEAFRPRFGEGIKN